MLPKGFTILNPFPRVYHIRDGLDAHMTLLVGDREALLFDTGYGLADLLQAVRAITPLPLNAVLSHGHYDHANGLTNVLKITGGKTPVYVHHDFLKPKYKINQAGSHYIGISSECLRFFRESGQAVFSKDMREILPGVYVTGEITRIHQEEEEGENFFLDEKGTQKDRFPDEQALFIDAGDGLIVFAGCAHVGIINILDHVQKLMPGRLIKAVLGGFHLRSAPDERIMWTISGLKRIGVKKLYACHCTGEHAVDLMKKEMPDECCDCRAGMTIGL